MKQLIVTIFIVIILSPFFVFAFDENQVFVEANKAYTEGDFKRAELGYAELLKNGVESAGIYNNLGETLFREGKIGEAIFQFIRAKRLAPRDPDINYNLKYALNEVQDKIEVKENILSKAFNSLASHLSLLDAWIFLIFISFVIFGLFSLGLFFRKDFLGWITLFFLILFIFSGLILVKKEFFTRPFGVVTAKVASVYSGPGKENVLLFQLHEGTAFDLMPHKEGDWIQIRLADGKKGWVREDLTVID